MLLVLTYSVSGINLVSNEQVEQSDSFSTYHESKMPELDYYDDYEALRSTTKVAVVYPIFTQSAYEWGGFHDFYAGYCDHCLKTTIQDYYEKTFASSGNGYRILEFLGYEIIDDIDLDKNPAILEKFDKVILLHNEFVTRAEFEAISKHPKVIYLYPNALSSEVKTDYSENTISLIRGPGFPNDDIINGFDWEFDNTAYFNEWSCIDWQFYEITNGYMLNCYPETELPHYGHNILKTIKTL
jgi:thiol-disulfide isomerase/thioredoxin